MVGPRPQMLADSATDHLGIAMGDDRVNQSATRSDLRPDDLVQLVVGVALATSRGDDADDDQAVRLLRLTLDAVRVSGGDA
ncbi:hypothetical protein [Frankia sp. R43]|uniref:hypothetical protein n=1 Tax=Frankia sp. R43 TaxID=269536 RepID=UPI000A6CED19|nr:hypothetical protein [Frankia sp. R43]